MNRVYKFRAWDKNENRMFEVDGILFGCEQIGEYQEGIWGDITHDFKDCELMQYTGLLDRSGKEIWEGDILQYDHDYKCVSPWIVIFKDGAFKKEIQNTWGRIAELELDIDKFKVIGNIYENPELLKETP